MKALVTGATGFLGSHIVDRLVERGDSVRALVRASSDTSYLRERGVEVATADITDQRSLPAALEGIDTVYHAAAHVSDWGAWREFRSITIDGTRNMLWAAAQAGVRRFLHVSTDGVYALSALGGHVTEESPLEKRFGWLDYYRRAKLAAERSARRYHRRGKLQVTVVRPALLLGERDRAMLPGSILFMKSKQAAYLGHGDNRLPYVYAGDVAAACVLAATDERAAGEVYNVVSDEAVTQRSFFEAIFQVTGVRVRDRKVPLRAAYAYALLSELVCVLGGRRSRPGLTRFGVTLIGMDYQEDASKIRSQLGWRPQVPLLEAVRRSVEWSRMKPAPSAPERSEGRPGRAGR